jgi:hypothetical protein
MIIQLLKYIALLTPLFLISVQGNAQETGNRRYLTLGGGWAHSGLRDRGLSPLYYSGDHAYITSGFLKQHGSTINSLEIVFMRGSIAPALYPRFTESVMTNMNGEISFSHLRLAAGMLNNNLNLFIGGKVSAKLGFYEHNLFVNSSRTEYSITTLNLSSRLIYAFVNNRREYLLELQLYIPAAAFIVRPSHAYIKPSGFLDHSTEIFGSLINSLEVSTVNRYFGLGTDISLEYPVTKNNALRLGYRWEYSDHRNRNQLQSAMHGIILQSTFNF